MTNLTNIGGGHMDKIDVTKLTQMSNFEVAALFYKYALTNSRGLRAINVGRGNPNWINTQARFAFNRIVEFGMKESLQTINLDDGNLAGYTDQTGIAECFNQFLDGDNPVDAFLKQAWLIPETSCISIKMNLSLNGSMALLATIIQNHHAA